MQEQIQVQGARPPVPIPYAPGARLQGLEPVEERERCEMSLDPEAGIEVIGLPRRTDGGGAVYGRGGNPARLWQRCDAQRRALQRGQGIAEVSTQANTAISHEGGRSDGAGRRADVFEAPGLLPRKRRRSW